MCEEDGMEEWKECKLGDLCIDNKGSYGIAASAVPYSENLYTYLRITDINDDGTLNKSDLKSVADENAEQYILQPNDIVFARTGGSTGRNYFYDGSDGVFVYAGFLIKFSIDPSKVNPKYIKYFCLSQEYKNWVYSFNTGSTRGNINAQTYANMPVILPPRSQQDLLVKTLSSLDDKIELNNKINTNLERQTGALFKNWFVDFEPFGGKMPEGWKEIPLEELCTVVTKGTTPTTLGKKFTDSGINFIKGESILDNHTFDLQKISHIDDETNLMLKRSIIQPNDILFTIAGTLGRFAFIDETLTPANTNQAVGIIRANPEIISPYYLYSFFIGNWHNDYYTKRIQQAVQANLSLGTIKSLPIIIPDSQNLDKYTSLVEPLFKKMKQLENENKALSNLRDTLLPKLMNGEIELDEVSK